MVAEVIPLSFETVVDSIVYPNFTNNVVGVHYVLYRIYLID